MAKPSQAFIRTAIRDMGMSLRVQDGEYRVNWTGGAESTAYYTSDAQDALDTAYAMHRDRTEAESDARDGEIAELAAHCADPETPDSYLDDKRHHLMNALGVIPRPDMTADFALLRRALAVVDAEITRRTFG